MLFLKELKNFTKPAQQWWYNGIDIFLHERDFYQQMETLKLITFNLFKVAIGKSRCSYIA